MAVSSGSAVFTPPSIDELFSPRGQILFQVAGTDREVVLGEGEDFSATPELTESEYRSKSFPRSKMIKKTVFADSVTLEMTLKSLNRRTLAALFMADVDSVLVQAAVPSTTKKFAKPLVGDIFEVGAFDAVFGAVTDGAASSPKQFVLGTHYTTDPATGRLEVIALPNGGAADIAITFTAPAISAADGRQAFGILESRGLRGKLTFRELGAEGPFNWVAEYWDVELRPSGAIPHLGGDEYANVELNGTVYARGGKPAGQEYGRVVVLPKA